MHTFCCYCTIHFFYELMSNRQSKTTAFFRTTFIAFIKSLKNMLQIFFFNAYSII